MTDLTGKSLLHYEVTERVGQGGMGEVYRARDTKLERDVALKFLPDAMADDPERLARFHREARTLASVHHPNVASVFGFEETEGLRFLVMELVEGEDLSQRISRGRLPLAESVAIARQVARGLLEAHDKGIVHRDLKPANIKLADGGQVKILDFGLARAGADPPAEDLDHSPTITAAMTQAGVILGTAAYMSPEQAKGRPVDKQSDIFSFGCVLFECLTGKQTFEGDSITDVLAAILRSEPDWSSLDDSVPRNVRQVLRRCLEKDPRRRFRDIGDVELLLHDTEEEPIAASSATPSRRAWIWPALFSLLLVALVGRELTRTSAGPDATAVVTSMSPLTDQPGLQIEPNVSRDGRQLLYVARDGGDQDIFVQRVGGENPVNLTPDSHGDDVEPAFSPDGDRIAFASDREGGGVFVMGATGETPRRVSEFGYDPAWSPDGDKLVLVEEYVHDPYSRAGVSNLWVVDLDSGEQSRLNEIDAAGPDWSPGGQRIAFWTHLETIQGQRDIWTIPAQGGQPRPVLIDVHTDWDPLWSPDGQWLYFVSDRGGTPDVWRIAIDETSGEASGDPQPVTTGTALITAASLSSTGRMAVAVQELRGSIFRAPFDPETLALDGELVALHTSAFDLWQMGISRDEKWITFGTAAGGERLYIMSVDGTVRRKLVDDEFRNRGLALSPDAQWGVFYSNRSGSYDLWAIRADGTGLRPVIANRNLDINEPFWSPDGRLFAAAYVPNQHAIEVQLPPEGIGGLEGPAPFESLPGADGFAGNYWSVDGRHLSGLVAPGQTVGVYSVADQTYEEIRYQGKPLVPESYSTWIDERRFMFWDRGATQTFVYDVVSKEFTPVRGIPGRSHFAFADGGRTLFINSVDEKSDLWLLELAEED